MVGQQESQAGHEVVEEVEDPPSLEPLPLVEPAGGDDDVLLPDVQQLGHEV